MSADDRTETAALMQLMYACYILHYFNEKYTLSFLYKHSYFILVEQ